jgi:hypothetical protein
MKITTTQRRIYPHLVAISTLMAMAGCSGQATWDKEYSCNGQERSSINVQGHPNFEKEYPIAIDFHVRADLALVKSYQVRLSKTASEQLDFRSKTGANWVSGSFVPKTGALDLVEGRTITVDGATQETRISGQYHCLAIGPAAS